MRWLALVLLGSVACTEQVEQASRSPGSPEEAPAASAADTARQEVVYVDVRTPEEYASGHVAGAINIPLEEMEARWQELAAHKDRPVALYCRSGRRSGLALDLLQARGFTQLRNAGGFEQLAAEGVPTAR